MEILVPVIILASLGLLFGAGLALASRFLSVKSNQRLDAIHGLLPGSNCGACGGAGCFGFAESLLSGKLPLQACKVSTEQTKEKIATLLGIKFEKTVKTVAVLHCNGGIRVKDKFLYQGLEDCVAANLVLEGQKECRFGCLGFGTCQKACPFGAIKMTNEQLPEIDSTKCKACGKCVRACPKHLFTLIPITQDIYIACSSHDIGKKTIEVCPVGCIACGICTKVNDSPYYLKDNLSHIDYKKVLSKEPLEEGRKKCPTKCILARNQITDNRVQKTEKK
ncbi:MAG: 4Fe-4S binding protein [Candidatus Omnitrophica bacterium]|jgi:Na+-translocating ferredoxin:NAD+ oxidoreductase RNF subunit RnfB|nr:4Fe-4S binding protein [Candidatus Omnitrophota bacterium]